MNVDVVLPATLVLAALFLTIFRLSGSSIPLFSASGRPDSHSIVSGEARPVRSDEWVALSPLKIGRVRADFPDERTYGMGTIELGDLWRPQLPSRSVGAAVFAPFNLPLVLLPLGQGFALTWWLPFFACLLGVYAWLRAMKIEQSVALVAALLTATAPAMVWWTAVGSSLGQIFAAATIPSALVIASVRTYHRKPRLAMLGTVVAGLAAASAPWYYTPWVLPTVAFVGGVTFLWGMSDPENRRSFLLIAGVALGVFFALSLVYLGHEGSYYGAIASTVYPGDRRATGGGVSLGLVFSSLFPLRLAAGHGARLVHTNLSEISMGWSIAAPCAVAVALLGRSALKRGERLLIIGAVTLMLALGSWVFVPWPGLLARLTLFDRIPPSRVAPLVGFFGVICLALLFGTADRRGRLVRFLGAWRSALITAFVVLVAALSARSLKSYFLPALSPGLLWLTVVCVGIATASLFTRWRGLVLGVAAAVALYSSLVVNPLTQGTGALDHSSAATLVRHIDSKVVSAVHGTWAGEDLYIDGLLNGEGVNSLSSFNDPVQKSGWRILDPHSKYEKAWNRLGYIIFTWQPGLQAPVIRKLHLDVVQVAVDPCDKRLTQLKLRAIISSENLASSCLTRRGQLGWMGTTYSVYERQDSS